ncbi:MAG: hypothetical protein ACR2FJ_02370 [Qipengyuania sp.]
MDKPRHITDSISDQVAKVEREMSDENTVPGPSPNPTTNLIIHDILLRSAGRLTRLTVEKALLGRRYGSQFAKDVVDNRSLVQTLAAYGVTKLATRSVPGALLVGGGLAIKTLFDRSRSKRKARLEGEKDLREQARG